MITRWMILIIALCILFSAPGVQAQGSAVLVYSPCMYCPGCFAFCAHIPPETEEPLCAVCQEGAPSIELPRTGQTLCYDTPGNIIDCAGTGQDGHLRAGVEWPSPRFTDNGDGSATDNLTGLVWLKDANCIATKYPDFDNDGTGRVTWQHALDFVKGINDGTYPNCGAGRNDWRLPNINEIDSLMNVGERLPYNWLVGQGFTNVKNDYYWSSTTYAYGNHIAWTLEMITANGTRSVAGKYSGNLSFVWPGEQGWGRS